MSYAKLFVAIGFTFAAAFAAIALRFLPAMNVESAPLARAPVVVAPAPPRLARHVVLVIADGLRLDTSRGLPFLDRLRAIGVDGEAVAPWPTLSLPNYVTILAGVEPRWSGVRNNGWAGHLDLDSLPTRLAAAGLRTGFTTDHRQPIQLFDQTWERQLPASGTPRTEDLLVIVPAAIDTVGHRAGGTSAEYRAAAHEVDRTLEAVLDDLDLAQDAIVIVADHGHTARGGHGGTEAEVTHVPLVLAGAGVRRGAKLRDASLIDVAPTIAAFLGVPAPAHSTGRTLIEALVLADETAVVRADADRRARLATARAAIEADELDAIAAARSWRIPSAALVLAIVIGLLVRGVRRGALILDRRVLAASVVFPIVFYAAIPTLPLGLTPAHSPGGSLSLVRELAGYLAVAAVAHLFAMVVAARGRCERAAGILAVGVVSTTLPALVTWALVGESVARTLPHPLIFMSTPVTAAAAAAHAGLCAVVLAAILVRTRARGTRAMVAPP